MAAWRAKPIVFDGNAGFVRLTATTSGRSAGVGLACLLDALRLCLLSTAVACLAASGCGSPVATLEITAPSITTAGSPFAITVTAMVNGSRDRIFNSPIHFISTDGAAVLPGDYAFTEADAGSHTFTGVTLMTAGDQSIKATDTIASSITATVNVSVSGPPATQ